MRFKSIGFLGAMMAMLTTLTGCDVEVTNKSTFHEEITVMGDAHADGCVSTDGARRETGENGCLVILDSSFVLVPSVKDKIKGALDDEGLSLDDADISINSVTITATASRFVGLDPNATVGPTTIKVVADGAQVLSLSLPSLTLNQPVTIQLPKPLLDKIAKNAKTGMPMTGVATLEMTTPDGNNPDFTGTVDLTVVVDATASVSIWAKIF